MLKKIEKMRPEDPEDPSLILMGKYDIDDRD